MATNTRRLAIFVAFSGTGGVERVVHNLLQGLSAHDIKVDLLAVVGKRGWLPEIPWPNIRVVDLGVKHSQMALPNPVITPDVYAKAEASPGHPWLDEPGSPPVILGVGRLSPEKDFAGTPRLRQERDLAWSRSPPRARLHHNSGIA